MARGWMTFLLKSGGGGMWLDIKFNNILIKVNIIFILE